MKYVIVLLVLVLFSFSGTKESKKKDHGTSYKIGSVDLFYEPPKGYKERADQFSEQIEAGTEEIEKNGNSVLESRVVLSVAKSDSATMNLLLVSEKNINNIRQFGLRGYRDIISRHLTSIGLEDYRYNFTNHEKSIDGIHFCIIEIERFTLSSDEYTHSSVMYIGEVDGRELDFTVLFDNKADGEKLIASIEKSRFVKSNR